MRGVTPTVSSGPHEVPALRRRMRGKQSPGAATLPGAVDGLSARELSAEPMPETPSGHDRFAISSSSVSAAPAWIRHSAKAGHDDVQVRDEEESVEHAPPRMPSAAELLANMRQGYMRPS